MDKGRKLKRYGRKDYTQLVEFPVEIIGRDGVVRRYGFEQSIRLYQRRIASAGLRYADAEIVHAERSHCRQRIQQLRRSYFVRHGWPALEQLDVQGQVGPGVAADLAAFLRRCLISPAGEGSPAMELVRLENQDRRTCFYLTRTQEEESGGLSQKFLVYVHLVDATEDCPRRARFFEELKTLQRVHGGLENVERLIAFHHTSDCGFILSQVGGPVWGDISRDIDPMEQFSFHSVPAPQALDLSGDQQALQLLRQGRHRGALRRFVRAYEENPLNRRAYLGAIVAADLLGVPFLGETAALMGSRVLSHDPDLHYHLAAVRLRLHRWKEAAESIQTLEGLSPQDSRLDLLYAALESGHHRYRHASRRLTKAAAGDGLPRQLRTTVRNLTAQLLLRRLLLYSSLGLVCVGIVSNFWFSGWGHGISLVGALIGLSTVHSCRRLFLRSLGNPGTQGLRLVDIACLARGRPTDLPEA